MTDPSYKGQILVFTQPLVGISSIIIPIDLKATTVFLQSTNGTNITSSVTSNPKQFNAPVSS